MTPFSFRRLARSVQRSHWRLFQWTLVAGMLGATALTAQQQVPGSGLWRDVNERALVPSSSPRQIAQYRTVQLDSAQLTSLLGRAPLEFTAAARTTSIILDVPWPDGGNRFFQIEESPVMEAGLAAQFPDLKTYRGQGLDDPTASMRFDWTPAGFHAMVLSGDGTVYIDPYTAGDTDHYISYYRRDYQRTSDHAFACGVTEAEVAASIDRRDRGRFEPLQAANGTQLRTYRLALAATGEYTAFQGGTVNAALSAMTTTMNRVNGVYERDFAVHMNMVANETSIIYTNGGTDPYTNNNGFTMLCENARNVDAIIGSGNYDIGHVFSTNGGGVAGLGVVCNNSNACGTPSGSQKGRGVTGTSSPTGDPFDIDYVAHEMGHQFGGNHTFNSVTSSCGGGNRNASTAYEPGSGSTIMAYAGICSPDDLQLNSNAYFHAANQTEVINYISVGGGSTCGTVTATGNTPPTVNAGVDYTIPMSTPFALTAAGSDPNGDAITYDWEEFDLGTASPPNADDGTRPIFRSYSPSTSPTRTFPSLAYILNNANVPPSTYNCSGFSCLTGEILPSTNRTMTFRVTARDNRANGGGTASDDMLLGVTTTSGPFVVTAPNSVISWTVGTSQSVTWNVANTTAAPVNAANVQILLSTDGGATFPTFLATNVPNNGSALVTVPNLPTSTARIKVQALGNVFFDVSNTNFVIAAAVNVAPSITANPSNQNVNAGQTASFSASASGSPTPTVQWQVSTNGGGTFNDIPGATSLTYAFVTTAADNGKQFRAVFTNAAGTATTTAALLTVNFPPAVVGTPANTTVNAGALASFSASATGNPVPSVQWQVSTNNSGIWTSIGGATSATYAFTTTAADNGKMFRAVFTNALGSAVTAGALLTVNSAPVITLNPLTQTVGRTFTVRFTAAATGVPTPTVKWQVSIGGGGFTDIPGATSTVYSFVTAFSDNGNQYRAVFTNSVSSTATAAAALTVINATNTQKGADFNGDDKADLLWRNYETGNNVVWEMNGGARLNTIDLGRLPNVNQKVVGHGDFNGDGKVDLVTRNNLTGLNRIHFGNGFAFPTTFDLPAVNDPNWRIVAIADFNGDGQPDIFWRNVATGVDDLWTMSGTSIAINELAEAVSDPNWFIVAAGDFDGDGKADLYWRQGGTGVSAIWFMNRNARIGYGTPPTVSDQTWQIVDAADWSGDGKADVLWRNSVTGVNAMWYMNGALMSGYVEPPVLADTDWSTAPGNRDTHDFNADGYGDLLWINSASGVTTAWFMRGATRLSDGNPPYVGGATWQLAGVGDFNGDGKPDFLWRNPSLGWNVVWLMNGMTQIGYVEIENIPAPWVIAAVADFDGDGKVDIVWRNQTTGDDVLWSMDGVTRIGYTALATVNDSNWHIVGAADFDGNGTPDLLWRNFSTGVETVWYMNGTTFIGSALLETVNDPSWHIVAVEDFNGDGYPDIVWRNVVSGVNVMWFMNNATRVGYATLTTVDSSWAIVPNGG